MQNFEKALVCSYAKALQNALSFSRRSRTRAEAQMSLSQSSKTQRIFTGTNAVRGQIVFVFIVFFLGHFLAAAQNTPPLINSKLTGVVVDALSKESLPGALVAIKGTTHRVSTDAQGKFSFVTGQKFPYTLVVSYTGFKTKELIVNESPVTIELEESVSQLSDVVVVGYGTQKRTSLTNSVAQISGEELTKRPVSNIPQALQGQLPGVTVIDNGGAPGRTTATLRVRGVTTFNINSSSTSGFDLSKNEALVIVDGIEQQLNDINPDDIETVSVLKDASSTAIYGSRATNGVILITTKRAKGNKLQVDVNSYYAVQQANNTPEQMGLEDYMRMQVAAFTNVGATLPARFTEQSIQTYLTTDDREKYPLPNTWFSRMLSSAPQQNYSVAIAGGNETVKTRASLRYLDQDGVITNFSSNLAELRVNNDFQASKKVSLSGDLNYRRVNSRYPTIDPVNAFFHGSLWAVPKYADGTYGLSTQGNNPLMTTEIGGMSGQSTDYLNAAFKGNWNIVPGLNYTLQLAGRAQYLERKAFANAFTNTDKNTNIIRRVPNNSLTETRNNFREYTINNLLTYERKFKHHNLKTLAGYSEIHNNQNYLSAYRERFYNNDIQSIGQGANDATKSNTGNEAEFGLKSFIGRVNYDFDGKYLLEVNGRYDGSSKFTGDKQYSFFPSVSAAWRISNENFWKNGVGFVNDFKLRGSWGITGNQSVDLYSYYSALSGTSYTFGGTSVQGYQQNTLANTDLGWESTTQYDIGIDASFFKSRLDLTVDYYNKLTEDILLNLDIPATIGLNAPPQNAGSVENKGWEFGAIFRNGNRNSKFRYNVGANLSINRNEVTDLKGTGPYITGTDINPRYIIAKGYPINSHWGFLTDGLFQTEQEIVDYKATYAANTKPGDVKYIDLNSDGKIDANDMTYLGSAIPKFTYGFNTNLNYKNFDLNLQFQGVAKNDVRLAGALAEMGNQEGFTHQMYADYWTPENRDARFPRPTKFDLRNVSTSDRLMLNGSYLRLKNIQFGYTLPTAFTRKANVNKVRVYASATNVFTISRLNEWNLDPEVESGRAVYYPQTSLYTFGINLQL
ncbi:SusC/RagA family TonB-linked outer membrane protein [Desertivirga arenae]|uniref:SusC/RagA family TonB-linked outer membrane protein n=1 Tax=Desertivirga arenae TaxID=2810309 RepID=UPI001A960DBB|nr:TonB-dependent receptor [Pedobacter sp. SYSU D00823]